MRANLLANLMVDGVVKTAIAAARRRPARAARGIAESAAEPADRAPRRPPGATRAHDARARERRTATSCRSSRSRRRRPTPRGAAKLADAAVAGLRDYLDSKAATEEVPDAQRLRVSGLGIPQARQVVRGPRLLFAIAAALFVFGAGCAAILGFFAVVRGWRAAAAFEALDESDRQNNDADSFRTLDELFDREHVGRPSEESEPVQGRNG